jgi:hypothetical protein
MAEQLERVGRHLPNRATTPLAVIALFLSLTEIVIGVGVIQTSGMVQIMLAGFVIAFDSLIALAFFVILWFRNAVLYPPSEYGPEVNPAEFVAAMQSTGLRPQEQVSVVAASALSFQVESPEGVATASNQTAEQPALIATVDELALAQSRIRELENESGDLRWRLHWESLNRAIYFSQFQAIQLLSLRGAAGATDSELQIFHDEHVKWFAGFSRETPNADVGQLMAWPMAMSLVTRNEDGRYYLGAHGSTFLRWVQNAPVMWRIG